MTRNMFFCMLAVFSSSGAYIRDQIYISTRVIPAEIITWQLDILQTNTSYSHT